MQDIQINQELYDAFINYLEAYLVRRDKDATFALFAPTLTGFGTGIDERAYTPEQFVADYKRDFEQAPNSIAYTLNQYKVQPITDETGVVFGELDIVTTIMDQSLRMNCLRISVIFRKYTDSWKLEHMHISFPTQEHDEGESFPLKELEDRAVVLQRLVQERTRDLEEARQELEKLAETDRMTGLYNRLKLDEILMAEVQRAKRYGNMFSILLFDLDNFKDINDTLGHQIGDKVLKDLANVISHRVRETDKIGRWGGDEFMIISPETNLEDASLLAEIIRVSLESHDFGINMQVTSSFGVTSWRENDNYNDLIDRADKALYQAKRSGKNQVSN